MQKSTMVLHSARNDELNKLNTNYKCLFCRNISLKDRHRSLNRLIFKTYYTVYNSYVTLRLI